MFEGFKKFIARGNMIDMAVGVVFLIRVYFNILFKICQ